MNPTGKSKLLVCIGNDESSFTALKFACIKAKKIGAVIELLSVIDTTGKGYELFSVAKVMKQEKREELEIFLNDYAKKVKELSGITPVINIREGFISDEITNVIENDPMINLVIAGSSPKSTSRGKLLSFLTEQIYSKLFIPIIIIPNNLTDHQLEQIA